MDMRTVYIYEPITDAERKIAARTLRSVGDRRGLLTLCIEAQRIEDGGDPYAPESLGTRWEYLPRHFPIWIAIAHTRGTHSRAYKLVGHDDVEKGCEAVLNYAVYRDWLPLSDVDSCRSMYTLAAACGKDPLRALAAGLHAYTDYQAYLTVTASDEALAP